MAIRLVTNVTDVTRPNVTDVTGDVTLKPAAEYKEPVVGLRVTVWGGGGSGGGGEPAASNRRAWRRDYMRDWRAGIRRRAPPKAEA